MDIGIFGGGFKPLTTGHFSKIALAVSENDIVVLYYGIAKRSKGSDFVYTEDMASQIYEINKVALERYFEGRVKVRLGVPTPIAKMFSLIGAIETGTSNSLVSLEDLDIDPDKVESISIYSDPDSLDHFTRHLSSPDKEKKYYGDMVKTGKLQFKHGLEGDDLSDISKITCAMARHYEDPDEDELRLKSQIRGSEFRSFINARDSEKLNKYLPPFLKDDERQSIIDILFNSCTIVQEQLLKSFIGGFIRG